VEGSIPEELAHYLPLPNVWEKLLTKLYNNQEKTQCSSGRENTRGNEIGPSSSRKLMLW
jgi:hypothetical protein